MAERDDPGGSVLLETGRLVLRPLRVSDAVVQRRLWEERDPRVPPQRRIDADDRPTTVDLAARIRDSRGSSTGTRGPAVLAVVRKAEDDVVGWCGLVDTGRAAGGEPELAFELLRRVHGRGYATEAASAVVAAARDGGHARLWATVWDWNLASRRVLAKLGFDETGRVEVEPERGTTLFLARDL